MRRTSVWVRATFFRLFNQEVLIPKRRNLRQVSNAKHLLALRQCF